VQLRRQQDPGAFEVATYRALHQTLKGGRHDLEEPRT
jgi:hypothetical protein